VPSARVLSKYESTWPYREAHKMALKAWRMRTADQTEAYQIGDLCSSSDPSGPRPASRTRIGIRGTALRQRRLGQRLRQPVLGVLTVVERGHLLVAEGRIQPAGFDEVVPGVQAQ
jgi:hypothetical protein